MDYAQHSMHATFFEANQGGPLIANQKFYNVIVQYSWVPNKLVLGA
jgi:hypothetical protein